jgi:hypothetical protein
MLIDEYRPILGLNEILRGIIRDFNSFFENRVSAEFASARVLLAK